MGDGKFSSFLCDPIIANFSNFIIIVLLLEYNMGWEVHMNGEDYKKLSKFRHIFSL